MNEESGITLFSILNNYTDCRIGLLYDFGIRISIVLKWLIFHP
jgi:hypothetical protein